MCAQTRLRFILSSETFRGKGVMSHVNSKGKIPSKGKILPRRGSNLRRCIKQIRGPNTLPTSHSIPTPSPHPHITNELFRPLTLTPNPIPLISTPTSPPTPHPTHPPPPTPPPLRELTHELRFPLHDVARCAVLKASYSLDPCVRVMSQASSKLVHCLRIF